MWMLIVSSVLAIISAARPGKTAERKERKIRLKVAEPELEADFFKSRLKRPDELEDKMQKSLGENTGKKTNKGTEQK